jgi:hypothetical protein
MRRITIIMAVAAALLAVTNAAGHARDDYPTVTVEDRPGAPREMLQQMGKLTGLPMDTVNGVIAVDTGGERLTAEQAEALAAGKEVDGTKVLGVMRGGEELLDTTMADLSDGTFDGPRGDEFTSSVVLFDGFVPGYEWCLTMCIASGRTVWDCVLLSRR